MAEPNTVVIDSRTCRPAPTCFARGVAGGKKVRSIKLHLGVEKHGFPLAIVVKRTKAHLIAIIEIALIFIPSRLPRRLTAKDLSAGSYKQTPFVHHIFFF
ncbi:hypothetical protein A6A40_23240 (plasmid) [Azospirillum humicireducens]|uniref:Transposase IS4-like domain-containing protein n=1 Tax=Azospirillum humicireducens TaxID=1226968 RepID=A0A2R4VU36_9PROT|nr:hypothetical protein [Azospirillum humicireducens]AWB07960.1 hypothetical protein A6A40_23240 [Azospirillum humicireducens]